MGNYQNPSVVQGSVLKWIVSHRPRRTSMYVIYHWRQSVLWLICVNKISDGFFSLKNFELKSKSIRHWQMVQHCINFNCVNMSSSKFAIVAKTLVKIHHSCRFKIISYYAFKILLFDLTTPVNNIYSFFASRNHEQ